jgi:hypothetical protein
MLSRSALLVYFPLQELLDSDVDSVMRVVRLHIGVSPSPTNYYSTALARSRTTISARNYNVA